MTVTGVKDSPELQITDLQLFKPFSVLVCLRCSAEVFGPQSVAVQFVVKRFAGCTQCLLEKLDVPFNSPQRILNYGSFELCH
jgi:hypothetical protein